MPALFPLRKTIHSVLCSGGYRDVKFNLSHEHGPRGLACFRVSYVCGGFVELFRIGSDVAADLQHPSGVIDLHALQSSTAMAAPENQHLRPAQLDWLRSTNRGRHSSADSSVFPDGRHQANDDSVAGKLAQPADDYAARGVGATDMEGHSLHGLRCSSPLLCPWNPDGPGVEVPANRLPRWREGACRRMHAAGHRRNRMADTLREKQTEEVAGRIAAGLRSVNSVTAAPRNVNRSEVRINHGCADVFQRSRKEHYDTFLNKTVW
jgi:hypothetical protein